MVTFTAMLRKFGAKGEKTGWTYIDVQAAVTEVLNGGQKKAFRVKGRLDTLRIQQVGLVPMGDSAEPDETGEKAPYILAINATMRRGLGKEAGATIQVELERDEAELALSEDLLACLADAPDALAFFETLPRGHQHYFSNWIDSAKTIPTREKRLSQAIAGLSMKLGYGDMIRHFR
jgi:hypothetical protein